MSRLNGPSETALGVGYKAEDIDLSEESLFLHSHNDLRESKIKIRCRKQILIVISCLTLTFTGCGFNFAFGVYQEHYEMLGGPFKDASPGEIDLIGTLAASLMTICAPFASSWAKVYGPRPVTTLGGILFGIALISASFGARLWQFQVTQGLLQGCAACLTYIPAVTVAPPFFNKRRGLAMGIIVSGTGLGGVVWAPVLRYLLTAVGFRNTLRVTGILAVVLITMSASVLEDAEESESIGSSSQVPRSKSILPRINWKIVRSRAFLAHACGGAFHSAAYFTPVYFMSSYARTLGYNDISGAYIIALSNACNFGGKIITGYLADHFGRLNALVVSTCISAAATFGIWCASQIQMDMGTRQSFLLAYATIYGLTAGSYVSLFPIALAEQFGIRHFANINGLLYMIRGFGTLIGTYIGGTLVLNSKNNFSSFDRMFLLVAALLSSATISIAWARSMKNQTEW